MGRFLNYAPCPKCREKGNDNRGDNLAMYSDGGGHCFSCGYHLYPKHYVPSVHKEKVNVSTLPSDFTRQLPAHARQWLLQWGLPLSYWAPFVGWSEAHSRLVFTVGAGPEFSQGRYLGEDPTRRKWRVWGESHTTPHILGNYQESEGAVNNVSTKHIVLVEDIISAHKVAMAGFPTICLFGTKIFDACIPVIRHIGLPVVVWLDKDQEQTMPKKCNWLAAMTRLKVSYAVTKLDPKQYNLVTINETLSTK